MEAVTKGGGVTRGGARDKTNDLCCMEEYRAVVAIRNNNALWLTMMSYVSQK